MMNYFKIIAILLHRFNYPFCEAVEVIYANNFEIIHPEIIFIGPNSDLVKIS